MSRKIRIPTSVSLHKSRNYSLKVVNTFNPPASTTTHYAPERKTITLPPGKIGNSKVFFVTFVEEIADGDQSILLIQAIG